MSGQTNYGTGSLQNNTGNSNSAFGNYAATSNQSGICITAVGANALFNNTTGPYNTSIGAGSMFYNETGDRNTAVGSSALQGPLAPLTTVGNQNVAIGAQALYSNYGDYNVAVGCYALIDNTDGSGNTAVGYQAGRDLSGNSNFNTFLGYNTDISSNTLVYSNSTALGYSATIDASNQIVLGTSNEKVKIPGSYVGIGIYNPSNGFTLDVGGDALINNVTVGRGGGNEDTNTAVGLGALESNTTLNLGGFQNTAVGSYALESNTDGIYNTAFGYNTLTAITNCALNTAIGNNAGQDLSGNSNYNTFLGSETDIFDPTLNYNNSTALGYNAIIDASNQIVLGGQSISPFVPYPSVYIPGSYVNIGGVYNPSSGYALDVSGILHTTMDASINSITVGRGGGNIATNTAVGNSALQANIGGSTNTAVGYHALQANIGGGSNTGVGVNALYTNTGGLNNTAVGYDALSVNLNSFNSAFGHQAGFHDVSGNTNTFIGYHTDVSNNGTTPYAVYTNSTAIGNGAIIQDSNQIVLGNSAIITLKCAIQTITSLSDARDKKDIEPLTNGINFIEKMNPVSFIWNMRDGGKVNIPEMGFIAQELKQVQEETGITVPNLVLETNPDRLEASYGTLLPILVKAVQELSAKVTILETELSELKK